MGHAIKHKQTKERCVGEQGAFLGVLGRPTFCELRKPLDATDDAHTQVPARFSVSLTSNYTLSSVHFRGPRAGPRVRPANPVWTASLHHSGPRGGTPEVPDTVIADSPHGEAQPSENGTADRVTPTSGPPACPGWPGRSPFT